jgi:1,4-dihydroxy-2-naphthoyl-CoA hydrolase
VTPTPGQLTELMPFAASIGVVVLQADPAEFRGLLEFSPERCTTGGILHGGALMALADSLGGACAFLNLPEGAQTATMTSNTSFLRGARGDVTAVARPLHVGRTVIVVQTDIQDGDGRLVAQVTQTQAVLTQPKDPR